jgi:hypothetical protein
MTNYGKTAVQYRALKARVGEFLTRVSWRDDRRFLVEVDKADSHGRIYVQVEADRIDVNTGEPGVGRGGKAYLTPYATDSELARTLLGLAIAYEEHEVREFFKVDGVAVFGPHISLDALLEAGTHLDYRDAPEPAESPVEAPKFIEGQESYYDAPVGTIVQDGYDGERLHLGDGKWEGLKGFNTGKIFYAADMFAHRKVTRWGDGSTV